MPGMDLKENSRIKVVISPSPLPLDNIHFLKYIYTQNPGEYTKVPCMQNMEL